MQATLANVLPPIGHFEQAAKLWEQVWFYRTKTLGPTDVDARWLRCSMSHACTTKRQD